MQKKVWLFIAAIALFIAAFYEAYKQDFLLMWVLFAGMGVCLGLAMRGRNTWMM